jgi:hypothetical protein
MNDIRCPDCVTDAAERFDQLQNEITEQSIILKRIDKALLGDYDNPTGFITRLISLEMWKTKSDKIITGFISKMVWAGVSALSVLILAAWMIVKSTLER